MEVVSRFRRLLSIGKTDLNIVFTSGDMKLKSYVIVSGKWKEVWKIKKSGAKLRKISRKTFIKVWYIASSIYDMNIYIWLFKGFQVCAYTLWRDKHEFKFVKEALKHNMRGIFLILEYKNCSLPKVIKVVFGYLWYKY